MPRGPVELRHLTGRVADSDRRLRLRTSGPLVSNIQLRPGGHACPSCGLACTDVPYASLRLYEDYVGIGVDEVVRVDIDPRDIPPETNATEVTITFGDGQKVTDPMVML